MGFLAFSLSPSFFLFSVFLHEKGTYQGVSRTVGALLVGLVLAPFYQWIFLRERLVTSVRTFFISWPALYFFSSFYWSTVSIPHFLKQCIQIPNCSHINRYLLLSMFGHMNLRKRMFPLLLIRSYENDYSRRNFWYLIIWGRYRRLCMYVLRQIIYHPDRYIYIPTKANFISTIQMELLALRTRSSIRGDQSENPNLAGRLTLTDVI